ncbi:uncharacterized protein BXIN_2591 [Babesia sp. Xinjiang]|uniref:uncharacterized protein n=1 Tax=Babesia sp. Xinjiang TaxID=462227 RepID=UPI000A242EE2|nr:uncharacterized protein BXIN_2591 [Babesia sp. Xinjiang]ORM41499.1 hypothetical protein BXIN_2591 [Babesia sp. Xinjiang]
MWRKYWTLLIICIAIIQSMPIANAWKGDRHLSTADTTDVHDGQQKNGMNINHAENSSLTPRSPDVEKDKVQESGYIENTLPKNGEETNNRNHLEGTFGLRSESKENSGTMRNKSMKMQEGMLNTEYFNTLLVVVAIVVAVLTMVSNIEMRIQAKDRFMRQAFDICVRQVVIMSLVTLSLYMVMHTDLAERLDMLFVRESKHIEVFDTLLQISFFLFCFFFLYCIYIGIVVSRSSKFIREADEADVVTTAKEYDFVKNSLIHCGNTVVDKTKYLVNRMEFSDMVKQRGYSDNCGCYFMDYMRASLIQIATTLLKISRIALLVALAVLVVLRIVGTVHIFRTIYYVTVLNTLAFVALALRLSYLDSQLYPLDLSQYLLLKLNVGNAGNALQPLYKEGEQESFAYDAVQSWLFGEGTINAHQNIFLLKQYGPLVLQSTFGTVLFCHLMILAVWCYCLRHGGTLLFEDVHVAAPLFATVLIICLVPKILYSLLVVTRCGHLIDFDLLDNILMTQKNENGKNAAQLIDALAMESVRFSLEKGGDDCWRMLMAKQKALPENITKQIRSHWDAICSGHSKVNVHQLVKYLQSQWGGSGTSNKHRMKEFVSQFMRHDPRSMNREEFMVLGYTIKHMILVPLEDENLTILFEHKFEIPWKAPCGIDLSNFDSIIRKLNLKWTKSAQRHFLEFIGGGAAEGLSPEYLIHQLDNFQQACQKNYFSAV